MDRSILEEAGLYRPAEKISYWKGMGRKEELERVCEKYPDVPRSIILKTDLQRRGVIFTQRAVQELQNPDYEHSPSLLFQYHQVDKTKKSGFELPYVLSFNDGTYWMVRLSPPEYDPYTVDFMDGKFWLLSGDDPLEELNTLPKPEYFDKRTSRGILMQFVGVPKPSDAVIFIPYHHCHYWNTGDQCLFCDMNYNTKLQRKLTEGEFPVRCHPQDIYETAVEILKEEGRWRHFCITGGSDPKDGYEKELEYYLACTRAIQKAFKEFCGKEEAPIYLVLSAFTRDQLMRLKEAGTTRYAPNMEVWDRDKFPLQCPGKHKAIGRDEWIRRMVDAVEIFGEWNVECAFVVGTIMAPQPYGFEEIDEAVASDLEGYKFCLDNSVKPINYMWSIMPGSYFHKIGATQPPLEFYIRVDKGRYNMLREYGRRLGYIPCGATDFRCCPQGPCFDWERLL